MNTVYQPAEDSFLMKGALETLLSTGNWKQKTVLDMGTGSGILAIAAAKAGCSVTAVDINPEALKLAKENAEKEQARVNFIQSDLFKEVEGKFDLIIFNPPYVPTEESETKDMQSIAWDGEKDGLGVINKFLKRVREFLKPGGRVLLLVSSTEEDPPKFPGFKEKLLAKKPFFFERLFVLELRFI